MVRRAAWPTYVPVSLLRECEERMPIDRANTGRSFPPTPPYDVEREKIREFADAIGEEDPAYRDPGAAKALGHPDVIAPPTFPIVLTYAANLPILEELGIALKDLLHGNQRFAYTRPIRAGDRLTCVVTIDNVRAIEGADIVTTRGEVSAVDGEHVVTTWCSLVIRGAAGEWDSAGQHDTGSG